jgi:hypothetical protein
LDVQDPFFLASVVTFFQLHYSLPQKLESATTTQGSINIQIRVQVLPPQYETMAPPKGGKPTKAKKGRDGGRKSSSNSNDKPRLSGGGGGGGDVAILATARGTIDGGDVLAPTVPFGIRKRADSTDSTRGVFYHDTALKNAQRVAPTVREVAAAASSELRQRRRRSSQMKKGRTPVVHHHHRHEQNASMASLASYVMKSIDPTAAGLDEIVSSSVPPHDSIRETLTVMAASPRTSAARQCLLASTQAGGGGADPLLPPQLQHRSASAGNPTTNATAAPLDNNPGRRESVIFLHPPHAASPKGHHHHHHSNSDDHNHNYRRSSVATTGTDSWHAGAESRDPSLFGTSFLFDSSNSNLGADNNAAMPAAFHPRSPNHARQNEINRFASLVRAAEEKKPHYDVIRDVADHLNGTDSPQGSHVFTATSCDGSLFSKGSADSDSYAALAATKNFCGRLLSTFDPTDWLTRDALLDEDHRHHNNEGFFEHPRSYTLAQTVRYFFYNPLSPEFTSLQQFDWAIVLGIVMGLYTALWKWFIEFGVRVLWKTIPDQLLEWGFFTDLGGAFPLPHYMWIVPAFFGGLLSYIFAALPNKIPDQNAWIDSVHSRGVQDCRTFPQLFLLSTAGMWSGLSLGPELPLVLTGGMAGSWLALRTKQSMLQARVMNLTAASAAVAGFFGFPMAGALFVLEL